MTHPGSQPPLQTFKFNLEKETLHYNRAFTSQHQNTAPTTSKRLNEYHTSPIPNHPKPPNYAASEAPPKAPPQVPSPPTFLSPPLPPYLCPPSDPTPSPKTSSNTGSNNRTRISSKMRSTCPTLAVSPSSTRSVNMMPRPNSRIFSSEGPGACCCCRVVPWRAAKRILSFRSRVSSSCCRMRSAEARRVEVRRAEVWEGVVLAGRGLRGWVGWWLVGG